MYEETSMNGSVAVVKKAETPLEVEAKKHVPETIPTLVELKKILPARCFQSNALHSILYALRDVVFVAVLYGSVLYLDRRVLPTKSLIFDFLVWPIYWFFQGTMMWALFVVAHDCGHGSFSKHEWLNDTVGNILNTFILVPYYAWKLSHRYHHKNTGNIDRDEIFYPERKEKSDKKLTRLVPFWGLGLSWFAYLLRGYGDKYRKTYHFNPWDHLFRGHEVSVAISVFIWCLWVGAALPTYAGLFGLRGLILHYLAPVFVFGSWLVIVTFLHHQDVNIPWYSDGKWDFVRGNLSSVDRHYGWAHGLTHNIGTHQIHHLFVKIPHYRLEEATRIFREKYPHLVRKSDEAILSAFARMFRIFMSQHVIGKDTQFHVYKDPSSDMKKKST